MDNHKWYVVHTYSNYEHKAKKSLEERIKAYECEDKFSGIFVPSEKVDQAVKGKKKGSAKKFFPGYMLVRMELNDKTWHVVMGTPRITGFVGGRNSPATISEDEVERLKSQLEEGLESHAFQFDFAVGDQVSITDGPFQNFNGVVDDIKPDKGKVRVLVSIFGRSTPVELNFDQVSKK